MTTVLIIAHRPLHLKGGGEKSMSIIARYLVQEGYQVQVWNDQHTDYEKRDSIEYLEGPMEGVIPHADVVMTWGRPANDAGRLCRYNGVSYVLCVRWWRNFCDITQPIGDLMHAAIDTNFTAARQELFDGASSIITNNTYSAGVIERYYNCTAEVSYVPIEGEAQPAGDPNGYIVAVSPDKGVGENTYIVDIANHMQTEKFLVVDPPPEGRYKYNNIETIPYQKNMTEKVWSRAKLFIQPVYFNDICGTLRTCIEAQQHGVPVISNDRCGIGEQVPNLVSYGANTQEWTRKIWEIGRNWEQYSKEALKVFESYDTPAQLQIFRRAIEKAVKKKQLQQ